MTRLLLEIGLSLELLYPLLGVGDEAVMMPNPICRLICSQLQRLQATLTLSEAAQRNLVKHSHQPTNYWLPMTIVFLRNVHSALAVTYL